MVAHLFEGPLHGAYFLLLPLLNCFAVLFELPALSLPVLQLLLQRILGFRQPLELALGGRAPFVGLFGSALALLELLLQVLLGDLQQLQSLSVQLSLFISLSELFLQLLPNSALFLDIGNFEVSSLAVGSGDCCLVLILSKLLLELLLASKQELVLSPKHFLLLPQLPVPAVGLLQVDLQLLDGLSVLIQYPLGLLLQVSELLPVVVVLLLQSL